MTHVSITPFATKPFTITAPCGIKELAGKAGHSFKLNGAMSKAKQRALAVIVHKVAGDRQPTESAQAYCARAEQALSSL